EVGELARRHERALHEGVREEELDERPIPAVRHREPGTRREVERGPGGADPLSRIGGRRGARAEDTAEDEERDGVDPMLAHGLTSGTQRKPEATPGSLIGSSSTLLE